MVIDFLLAYETVSSGLFCSYLLSFSRVIGLLTDIWLYRQFSSDFFTVTFCLSVGSLNHLLTYETERQRHNLPVLATIDGLQRLYSTDFTPFVLARSLGLTTVNSLTMLKVFVGARPCVQNGDCRIIHVCHTLLSLENEMLHCFSRHSNDLGVCNEVG